MPSAMLPPRTAALPDTAARAPLEPCGHTGARLMHACAAPAGAAPGATRASGSARGPRTCRAAGAAWCCPATHRSIRSARALPTHQRVPSRVRPSPGDRPTARASTAGHRTGQAAPGDSSQIKPRPSEPSPARCTVALQDVRDLPLHACPLGIQAGGQRGERSRRAAACTTVRRALRPARAPPRPSCAHRSGDALRGPLQHGIQVPQAARSLLAGHALAQLLRAQHLAQRSGARARDRVRDPPPACDERCCPELRRPC
jgi:hypothetical protein